MSTLFILNIKTLLNYFMIFLSMQFSNQIKYNEIINQFTSCLYYENSFKFTYKYSKIIRNRIPTIFVFFRLKQITIFYSLFVKLQNAKTCSMICNNFELIATLIEKKFHSRFVSTKFTICVWKCFFYVCWNFNCQGIGSMD